MRLLPRVVLVLCLACASASASSLRVHPLLLSLGPGQRATELQLRNTGDAPVLIEIEAQRWQEIDGEDALSPTRDIVLSPPLLELRTGAEQIVRIGLRGTEAGGDERAYRLFVTELPGTPDAAPVRFNVRLSLPFFVRPDRPSMAAHWRSEAGRLRLVNAGNVHLKLLGARLQSADGRALGLPVSGPTYLLPQGRHDWTLENRAPTDAAHWRLMIDTPRGELEAAPGLPASAGMAWRMPRAAPPKPRARVRWRRGRRRGSVPCGAQWPAGVNRHLDAQAA